MKLMFAAVLIAAGSLLFAAEESDTIYKLGLAKLREAQADHSALVPATKLLAQAAELYEKAGDEAKVAEVNSCLYWAKKRMTLADTQSVRPQPTIVGRLEAVAKPVAIDQAQAMLDKAEAFAKGHADDPLLVSIRFFEVADRFPDSPEGKKAMQQSLAAMQKVGEKAKLAEYKPAPTDGKVFVKSEPPGAAIIFVAADGGKVDTGKVTPALVQLPTGKQSLQLSAKSCKPSWVTVEVDGKAIARPDAFRLEPLTVQVDIVFEGGWLVFVDGKPAKPIGLERAETPCTAELPLGRHELSLAKEGFIDVRQQVEVVEGGVKVAGQPAGQVEIKYRPSKGTSSILRDHAAQPAPNQPVEVLFEEEMGYTVTGLKKGVPYQSNSAVHLLGEIPKEWAGKSFTQAVDGRVSPVKMEFKTPGKIYISVWQAIEPAAQSILSEVGQRETIRSPMENHAVWSVTGKEGQVILFPNQVQLIADKLTKVRTGALQQPIAGRYEGVHPDWRGPVLLKQDGTFTSEGAANNGGRWEFKDATLTLFWNGFPSESLKMDGKGNFKGTGNKEFTLTRIEGPGKPVEPAATKSTDTVRVIPVASDAETLKAMIREAKTPEDARKTAEAAMQLCLKAVAIDDYVTAESAVADASSLAQQIKDVAVFRKAQQLLVDVSSMKSGFTRVQKDIATLKANQDDAPANLAVGKFYCFAKGNWKTGIPHLARGSDAVLRSLAAQELQEKPAAESLAAIGSSWWEQVPKLGGVERQNAQGHAIDLHLRAQPGLNGVQRLRVDKRLSDVFASDLPEIFNHGLVIESVSQSEQVGGGGSGASRPQDFTFVVGAKLGKGSFDGHAIIRALQPIMLTKNGLDYRTKMGGGEPAVEVMAKPGYALGGLMVNKGPKRINGLRFVFMRVIGPLLDPGDKYESEWICERSENAANLSAHGKMIVGFTGGGGADLDCIGVVFLEKWGFTQ